MNEEEGKGYSDILETYKQNLTELTVVANKDNILEI